MQRPEDGSTLPRLVSIMQRLLAPDGCPWDREQTLASLRNYVIEEAHEVVDAIDRGDPADLREELGDLLLQIVFQAELARKQNWFGPDDVIDAICEKLVRRHPHVFGNETVANSAEVLTKWELIKARERRGRGALEGVPVALPSLLRALRMSEKAARVGFDWPDGQGARAKVSEELGELDRALDSGDKAHAERELGDLLFALVNYARKLELDPEAALRGTLARFAQRVQHVEQAALAGGRPPEELSPAELDALWVEAKRALE
ncbi:MAG TPA: nucleoside triphosphate pyrophosphohydrolase [Polyangiales bacterium]|nr:nucleoside triphosphate pyrophosphohydrolase [Polyangiales bacterium]